MPQSKALPKERYARQRRGREVRRALASINPSDSHPQEQCLFFSKLPAEIRLSIYQHVLCQTHDHDRPVDAHSISPLFRPNHGFHTIISASLLRACRLIYYEAHLLPILSATHHFRFLGSTSWLYNGSIWLHHMTSQQGDQIYHLHDNLVALNQSNFSKFLLPHLKWKKVTYTVCAYLIPTVLAGQGQIRHLADRLAGVVLPESCREVTLELETRDDLRNSWSELKEQASQCRQLAMQRRDGTRLEFDESSACQYTWVGSGHARWGTSVDSRETQKANYHTIRLCWRTKVTRREYMSYDQLDCLSLAACPEVTRVMPPEWFEGSA